MAGNLSDVSGFLEDFFVLFFKGSEKMLARGFAFCHFWEWVWVLTSFGRGRIQKQQQKSSFCAENSKILIENSRRNL